MSVLHSGVSMKNTNHLHLGIQWIIVEVSVGIPGPIMFGAVLDLSYSMWQSTCEEEKGPVISITIWT